MRPVGVDHFAGARVERACEVVFLILPWSQYKRLDPPLDIGEANARVQVDIRFVYVEDLVVGAGLKYRPLYGLENGVSASHRDAQRGPRAATRA